MAKRNPARLTPTRFTAADGRRFATSVGIAFATLGVLLFWRGHRGSGGVASALGILLAVAGLVAPRALGPVSRGWMRFAVAISAVTTPILLALVYFVTIVPMALVLRLVGRRPLSHGSRGASSAWVAREAGAARRSDLTRQF